jgi:8-oxo-dGTP pyrophosphatase MutT (NUDIX family)
MSGAGAAFDEADFLERLAARLDPLDAAMDDVTPPIRSDFDLNPQFRPADPRTLIPAAVLAPVVLRPEGATLLLTQRTASMPTHAGQVAFPGGRMQPEDGGVVHTALRETEEETGIARAFVRPLGVIDAYETVTGFHVRPVVALVTPGFTIRPDPREVDAVFETPVSFLMNPANHERREREWQGVSRAFYAMPHGGRFIWGATAGMIKALYDRLYSD